MGKLYLLLCVAFSCYLVQVSQAGKIVQEKATNRVCDIYYERNSVCDVTNVGLKVRETSLRMCRCADRTWMRCEQTTRNCRPDPSTIVALTTAAKEPEPEPELPAAVNVEIEIPSEVAAASEVVAAASEAVASASDAATKVLLGQREELVVTNDAFVPAALHEDVVVAIPHQHIHDDNDPNDYLHHQESTKEIAVDIKAHDVPA